MGTTTWIDLVDPTEDQLREAWPTDLHVTALDLLLAPTRHGDEPRPKFESHGTYALAVLLVIRAVPEQDRMYHQEVDLVLSHDLVLTVRKTPDTGDAFDVSGIRAACQTEDHSPGMVAYLIVDDVAEAYLDLLDDVHDELDELEDQVETAAAERIRSRISELRHDLLHIRKTLAPTRDGVRRVVDNRVELEGTDQLFPREVELHFADAYDKLLRATEGLEAARDMLGGVRDYHQSKVANDQNEVMKVLTVIAALLLLPTFIVGLYGQNFKHIPELGWAQGYGFSWALIVTTTLLQLWWFRRKHWI